MVKVATDEKALIMGKVNVSEPFELAPKAWLCRAASAI